MFKRIRIVEETGVFIAVVLDRIIFLVTHAIWEVVRDTIAMAYVTLVTKAFNFIELWILVNYHN
jgi:hypothetical protein